MALPSRRLTIARDAVEIVVRSLSTLPTSPEVEALRVRAIQYARAVDGWTASPPTSEERDKLMKRILKLHVEVARLERATRT